MIKYEVNKEEGTVKATMKGCANDVYIRLMKVLPEKANVLDRDKLWMMCQMKNSFVATAHCDPADEFNEETGKRLASDYILRDYYTNAARVVKRLEVALYKDAQAINNEWLRNFNKMTDVLAKDIPDLEDGTDEDFDKSELFEG